MFTFSNYADEESDDVIGGYTNKQLDYEPEFSTSR